MRKSILTMACLGLVAFANAQETVITEKDGKVGIGTPTPAAKLHVQSSSNSEIYNTYFTGNALHFNRSNGGSSYLDKTDSGDLILRFGLPVTNRFTFKNDGSFGIGTTTPSEKLEIYDSTTTPGAISLKSFRNDAGYVDVGRISAKQNTTEVSRIGMPRAGGTYTGYLTFWTKDNNNASLTEKMRINEFGNVGIGNASPVARLHVVNSITGQGDSKGNMSKNSVLTLKPHATNSTNMQFAQVNNGNGMGIQVTNSGNTANWDIALNPYGGNVGIGTTAPNSKLEVYHSSVRTVEINPQNQLDVTGNSSLTIKEFVPSIEYQDSSNSSADAVTFANNNKFYIGKKTGSRLINSSLFNVDLNNGRVGVGVISPSEKLEIYDSTTTPGVISLKSIRNDAGFVDVGRISAKQATTEVSRIGMPRAGGTYTGYLTFWTKESNSAVLKESMRIDHSGNVGIGTTTPDAELAVNGLIHTKEVKVDLVGWPDYVFEDKYELPSLKELENHITQKGHLPNIPSAKEVEKAGGIQLGEMNKKLLEKVEELTLYTIQQEKELKKQSKEIERLKSQNSKLLELAKEIEIIKQKLK